MLPISLESLTRRYGRRRGVDDVTLSVPEGSLFGFLGPNGAGKTTTIRVMLGFLRPTRGAARVFGLDCWRESRRIKADVGYLPGDLRLYPWLTGREALRLFGAIRGRDLARAGRELADELALDLSVKSEPESWAARLRGRVQPTGTVRTVAHGRISLLPGFAEGEWWVQDAAAALPARLFGDVNSKRVADLCAAPGGKTAQLAHAGAKVTAVDRSEARLNLLRDNLARLHLQA